MSTSRCTASIEKATRAATGNSSSITQGKATNLHRVWDTFILRDAMKGTPVADYAEKLAQAVTDEQAKEWAKGNTATWASEGRAVAAKVVYAGVPADQAPKLSEEYLQAARPVIDEQLKRAGVRLAMVLNDALGR